MQQSNEAGKAVSATTKRGPETRSWDWAEASIWSDRMLAALVNGVKGGKWYSLMDKVIAAKTLGLAWERVRTNGGAAGVDRMSIERFEAQADRYLAELQSDLEAVRYRPEGVRRVYIPKSDGKQRPLGIPTVKDRIVQTALKLVVEPIFENEFLAMSYGFRPGKGCKDALREVDRLLKEGYTWVVDADLKSYFDTIPKGPMLARVAERISDGKVLGLIQQYLEQEILDGLERWTPIAGTPQGAVLSPLLANLYLHPLDRHITGQGWRMVRYADDFVILCRDKEEAERALQAVRDWTEANGLTLHPDKTHLGDSRERGQGFDFLGYHFEAGRRWVRKKSDQALKDKIREKTRRNRSGSLREIVRDLNPMLQGWFGYFKHAARSGLTKVDQFVRRRLRAILLRRHHKRGKGKSPMAHRLWPNAYFASLGLFTMKEAHAVACRSR